MLLQVNVLQVQVDVVQPQVTQSLHVGLDATDSPRDTESVERTRNVVPKGRQERQLTQFVRLVANYLLSLQRYDDGVIRPTFENLQLVVKRVFRLVKVPWQRPVTLRRKGRALRLDHRARWLLGRWNGELLQLLFRRNFIALKIPQLVQVTDGEIITVNHVLRSANVRLP